MAIELFTVGHSNRALEELLELLEAHRIEHVVDVRRYPGSRRHPHFAQEALAASLQAEQIAYDHEPRLGGRRKPQARSPNAYWENAQFRGYADYMASSDFQHALTTLIEMAQRRRTAVMCAEATPWRCHRQLIADALVAKGHRVLHVLDARRVDPHLLNGAAVVNEDGTLRYPAQGQLGLFS